MTSTPPAMGSPRGEEKTGGGDSPLVGGGVAPTSPFQRLRSGLFGGGSAFPQEAPSPEAPGVFALTEVDGAWGASSSGGGVLVEVGGASVTVWRSQRSRLPPSVSGSMEGVRGLGVHCEAVSDRLSLYLAPNVEHRWWDVVEVRLVGDAVPEVVKAVERARRRLLMLPQDLEHKGRLATGMQKWWRKMRSQGGASLAEFSVRDAFDAFDADGNGELDMDELRAALCDLGTVRPLRLSRDEVDVLVSVCDADGSGTVSFSEFSALLDNRFVVLPGDTLYEISKRVFGRPNRWREIGKVNGIKKPEELLVGAVLKIPGVSDIIKDGEEGRQGAPPTGPPQSPSPSPSPHVEDARGTPLRLKQRPPPSATKEPAEPPMDAQGEEDTRFSELLSPGGGVGRGGGGKKKDKGKGKRRGGGPDTPLRLAERPPPPTPPPSAATGGGD